MSSRTKLFLLIGLAFLPLVARADLRVGEEFPPLSTAGLTDGKLPATKDRIVLVDFWASWCAPCRQSFPSYARLLDDYREKGLVIVAVSVDEQAAAYRAFVEKYRPPFAAVRDATQELVSQVKVAAMPTCYLLDRAGKVRFVHHGFHGSETENQLRQEIDRLLAETRTSS